MKRWIWIASAAAILLLGRLEHTGVEISELEPVEVIRVSVDDSGVTVETDTGALGIGADLESAVEDLRSASSATVFLDTAEYLILSGQGQQLLPQLYDLLRPACRVCIAEGELDLTQAGGYLKTHSPETKLLHCRAGQTQLQTLYFQEGRGALESGIRYP